MAASSGAAAGGSKAVQRAERNIAIWHARLTGRTIFEIGREFEITPARVSQICKAMIDAKMAEARDQGAEWIEATRTAELVKLDVQERKVWEVIERKHYVINAGVVVRDYPLDPMTGERMTGEDGYVLPGVEIEDDGPILAAINGALDKIGRRRAALIGLDSPVKTEVSGKYELVINGVDIEALK